MESEPSAYYQHSKTEFTSQDQLVDQLKATNLFSGAIEKCMRLVDRRIYIPGECDFPYADQSVNIGYGAWIPAPSMHAFCLNQLADHLKKGANLLDIGSGTGYLTTVMALMMENDTETRELGGHVFALEHIPELAEISRDILSRYYPNLNMITVLARDGRHGLPENAPYDCIHIGAAPAQFPTHLIDQLKPGGRLICPVGIGCSQQLLVVDKRQDGTLDERVVSDGVEFPPLTSVSCQLDVETFD